MQVSLKNRLEREEILVAPGVYDALTARMVEEAGFHAGYLSGAGVSYSHLGKPDVGLVTLREMADRAAAICSAVSIPIIADGDNGHGNALNLMRTVELFERAGVAAVQFEDQAFPKRCGHLGGARLVATDEMVAKIRAARRARQSEDFLLIGRTDARAGLGLDAAIARARAYREAGADILFVEAPQSEAELAAIANALPNVPLVANMVEGGKTPLLGARALENLGYSLVLFPNSLIRLFTSAGRDLLRCLSVHGTTASLADRMCSFGELQTLVGGDEVAALESEFVVAKEGS